MTIVEGPLFSDSEGQVAENRKFDQLFYFAVRDALHAGKPLPFPESTFQTNALIYAVVDHNDFYEGKWPAAMARLAACTSAAVTTDVPTQVSRDRQVHTYQPPPPRRPRPTDREIMRRRNRLEEDPDGKLLLKVLRHRHESLQRLELQVDVLKEELERWPGKSISPASAAEIKAWYADHCRLRGVSKLEVVVPEVIIPLKSQLEILIEVLIDIASQWRKRIVRVQTDAKPS